MREADKTPDPKILQHAAPSKENRTQYPSDTVQKLLQTDLVTEPTRRALTSRLHSPVSINPTFFDPDSFQTLKAACARLIPQPGDGPPIDLAGEIDHRLAARQGNGWRYAALPPDGQAYQLGLRGMNCASISQFGIQFFDLPTDKQDQILLSIQQGTIDGDVWQSLPPARFFEELLAEVSEIYFSSPVAQSQIGYAGMADRFGWPVMGLDQLMPHEPRPLEQSGE